MQQRLSLPRFKSALSVLVGTAILVVSSIVYAADNGLFWKLESPTGVTSYLFGTMHTDDNRITQFSPTVKQAIQSSDTFMMEVTAPQDHGVYLMKEGNLAQLLTNDEFEQVRDLADFHVMHLGVAMQMKPWLLAVIFDSPKPQTPFAQDNLLMSMAEEQGKAVVGIETVQEHFSVMDSFSIEEQTTMLRSVLKRTQSQKERDYERLLKAYLQGNAKVILQLDSEITSAMLPDGLWPKMRKKLIDERNLLMAERTITAALQQTVFIAVGAAHLGGENGLIAAFSQAGFKLTPLKK